MAAIFLVPGDLAPFAEIPEAKAQAMIDDAVALAVRVAPCINEPEFSQHAAARAILRGAVLRWNEAGTGALHSETLGSDYSYTTDNRQQRRGLFWPSEIEQLQGLCRSAPTGAFSVDTLGGLSAPSHSDVCALQFGALYCSCGASLTLGQPLWEWPWSA